MSRARYSETRALRLVSVQESLEAIDGRVAMAEGNRGDLAMEQQVHTSHAWSLVEGQLETLAPKLRTTIVGISCGKTLKQLGQQLGVTEARVCQLRQQAIRQLRLRCAERGLPMSVAA